MQLEREHAPTIRKGNFKCGVALMVLALSAGRVDAAPQGVPTDGARVQSTKRHLPYQGGFRNGQAMWDWLGGAGDVWYDGGSAISTASAVSSFILGKNGDAMRHPRPKKVRLYMQGHVPRLGKFTYAEAAANDPAFRQEWVAIARTCVDAGYKDCVFGSSETQTGSKPWTPTAEEMRGGHWRQAWINMVEDVRSVMPDAKFAFVPMSGGQDGLAAKPKNGILDKDDWYVPGKDSRGNPYMDYWGMTIYLGTHGTGYSTKDERPASKEVIDKAAALMRKPSTNPHTDWGYMGHVQYAAEKGIKLVIGELGIFDRFTNDRPNGTGDQPYAIDKLTEFVSEHADQIELVCWFNSRGIEGRKRVWSRLDVQSSMPNAARRVQELWGPESPYRK